MFSEVGPLSWLPRVLVPATLHDTTTGSRALDLLPLLSMLPTLLTLNHFRQRGRWLDLVLFGAVALLATGYHICHMQTGGLHTAQLLGMPGALWRSLDIVMAQFAMGRTLGHAVGAKHWATVGLANMAFPAAVLAVQQAAGHLTLAGCAKMLAAVLAAVLGSKALLEGPGSYPSYGAGGRRAAGLCTLGFVAFLLPTFQPELYWLWHSLWHVFMFVAYWELYCDLECPAFCNSGQSNRAASVTSSTGSLRDLADYDSQMEIELDTASPQSAGSSGVPTSPTSWLGAGPGSLFSQSVTKRALSTVSKQM